MRRTSKYAAKTQDEAQRRRWPFYEGLILGKSYACLLAIVFWDQEKQQ
jgi:hypothetical protein